MESIKIYKKTNHKLNLFLAITWLLYGIKEIFFSNEKITMIKYFVFLLGLCYILLYYYEMRPFYIIKNDIITKNHFPKKEFNLAKLDSVEKNINGYILTSKNQKDFKINPENFKSEELQKLNSIIESY